MDFKERALGAFWGLAVGDAYGRELEFVGLPRVRTQVVSMTEARWTDDTHMAMYLARAILDLPPASLDEGRFGKAVGDRFVQWSRDPLTPSTAPGNTCLAGAAAFARSRDWTQSGVKNSDGCGAVMRIAPLAMAFQGEELVRAARVSAAVTHAHPNALEAAVAGAVLLREVLDTGALSPELVLDVAARLRGPLSSGGMVADSLEAAVAWARGRENQQWLDEAAIPAGDGGWRSPSALGLALAAALAWPRLPVAVEKAARIAGDSDSVACLAGMLLGAVEGPQGIPEHWLAGLQERDTLAALADSLVAWGAHEAPKPPAEEDPVPQLVASLHLAGARFVPDRDDDRLTNIKVGWDELGAQALLLELARALDLQVQDGERFRVLKVPVHHAPTRLDNQTQRTSATDPLEVAWLASATRGRIGLTFAPGKRGISRLGAPWARDLDMDLDRLAETYRTRLLVCMLEDFELEVLQIPGLIRRAEDYGMVVHRQPTPDGGPPNLDDALRTVDLALSFTRAGRNVVFHCRGGLGRAGTMAALSLVRLGVEASDAIAQVRAVRPGAIENAGQERAIYDFQVRVAGR